MATDTIAPPYPTVHFIYALLDPRTENIYYVGQTVNIADRLYAHKYNGKNSKLTIPVYKVTKAILKAGLIPQVIVLDSIETPHRDIVMRLEECWRIQMLSQDEQLSNAWKTGVCVDTENPIKEIEIVKGYALATPEQLLELKELDKVRALEKIWGNFNF